MNAHRPHLLPPTPDVSPEIHAQIRRDHDHFGRKGLPRDLDRYLRETYLLDMTASYAGIALRNPWGKASGQLSLNRAQVEEAALAGLGLVVLKTVIASDQEGRQTMSAWAIKESQMVAEPITSRLTGASGWTITWKGRGWWQSFDEYLELVRQAVPVGRQHNMLVVPSVKYHLPAPGETAWHTDEYIFTTRALLEAFQAAHGSVPMPIEKDFSPTLAGSDRAGRRTMILEWLRRVPVLIRLAVQPDDLVKVGLKLFNSLEADEFQLAMLAAVHRSPSRPDYLIYANRLFDPDRVYEGTKGVAYGGPDLSDRNLRLLSALRSAQRRGEIDAFPLEISGTGDIHSGRIAVEYALRGCTSFQIHTLFQLPASEFSMRTGTKIERALHRLYFDPDEGLIVWAFHAANRLGTIGEGGVLRFLDLARRGARSALLRRDLDAEAP
jgi:dihydroorotate dehydrogenase